MKNKLYRIEILHGAPKDNHFAYAGFLIAENNKLVFEYLKKHKIAWEYIEDGYDLTQEEIIKSCGDFKSEDGWEDAYYGVTKWSWKCLGNISSEEIKTLKKFDLLHIKPGVFANGDKASDGSEIYENIIQKI